MLERDCFNVDIEADEAGKYFAYKAQHGFVVGYFHSDKDAELVDERLDVTCEGTIDFVIDKELSKGEIRITKADENRKNVVPFSILDPKSIRLYEKLKKNK